MSSSCKGYCTDYMVKVPLKEGYYENGRVFCRQCETYMQILTLRCPCCKSSVRHKPRTKKLNPGF